MLYRTHKAAGVLMCLVAYDIMQKSQMLPSTLNPYVQLAILYPICSWASTAPDLDHALSNVKEQTPLNILIHKLLHIGKCTHRSVQTHSILITGGFCGLLCLGVYLLGLTAFDALSLGLVRLMVLGIILGIASHLFMDSLTTGGIWIMPKVKYKIKFVPTSSAFATGGAWEDGVRRVLYLLILYMAVHILIGSFGYSVVLWGITLI